MKDTVQELLKPRYKVIAGFPVSPFVMGEILEPTHTDIIGNTWVQSVFDKYPHLFKPLAWYEEREASEMPEYVKSDEGLIGKLGKQYSHNLKNCCEVSLVNGNVVVSHLDNWQPATEKDFQQYLNNLK